MNTNIFDNTGTYVPNNEIEFRPSLNIPVNNLEDERTHATLGSRSDIFGYYDNFMKNTNHPYICLLHICFKLLSIIIYFLGPLLFRNTKSKENDFILTFAFTFIMVSIDFYLVKNITGRFLVKMIWWNDIREDYSSSFVFYATDETTLNKLEKNIFWYSQYAFFCLWLLQTIQMLISLQICWFLLCVLCLTLSFCNVFNFWKSSKEQHNVVGNILNKINPSAVFKKIFIT